MSVILRGAVRLYYYLNEEIADEKTQNWFLMRTPWPGLAFLAVYLLAVTRWLPAYMRTRPAFDLRLIIAGYNLLQIAACLYIVYHSLTLGWLNHYRLVCQPVEEGPLAVEFAWKVCYLYFLVKIVDLFDTVFFVLRKKEKQVSFLHVYHHFGMVMVSWGIVKWVPGGHGSMLVALNSFVHVVMYTYYLLSTWDDAYKRSLWWKKHVTQLQILQFTLIFLHFVSLVVAPAQCGYPRPPAYLLLPQNLFMVILFSDFYYRTYVKKTKTT